MKNKHRSSSIPHKLNFRQILGNVKYGPGQKPFRFYEKCPETLQIPLMKIMKKEELLRGQIAIGFTEDGKYFVTYTCNIKFQLTSSALYKYTLCWWAFDLWRPLKKVYEVELFPNENISNEIHLMVCQSPKSNFILVHGSTFSVDCQSRRMCYVSLVPRLESNLDCALHWKYELLPPYPPFVTSVSLKLPNVVVMNSGDMMFAILTRTQDLTGCASREIEQRRDVYTDCFCQHQKMTTFIGDADHGAYNVTSSQNDDTDLNNSSNDIRLNDNDIPIERESCHDQKTPGDNNISNSNPDYVSYIRQGFSYPCEEESEDLLADSPFDWTAIPCSLTSLDGSLNYKIVYEHRCLRSFDKGSINDCQYHMSQVQFVAESFLNEELLKSEFVNRRFVSLRDYDMQLVDVCQQNNAAIVLINALIVLRTSSARNSTPKTALEEHQMSRLAQYTAGYLLSWNVYNGKVNVLQTFPLVERVGNTCKSRHFSPSVTQTVQLRKKWFVPSCKEASTQTLSNHTVFTGKSLQFLVHPEFPVAIVL